jgi:hypothetical protein
MNMMEAFQKQETSVSLVLIGDKVIGYDWDSNPSLHLVLLPGFQKGRDLKSS